MTLKPDQSLIDEIVATGVEDRAAAENMADRVFAAVAARIRAGRTVTIAGVGRLGSRTKWQDTYCRGPGRVQVTTACIKDAAELSRGEPVPSKGSRP